MHHSSGDMPAGKTFCPFPLWGQAGRLEEGPACTSGRQCPPPPYGGNPGEGDP